MSSNENKMFRSISLHPVCVKDRILP